MAVALPLISMISTATPPDLPRQPLTMVVALPLITMTNTETPPVLLKQPLTMVVALLPHTMISTGALSEQVALTDKNRTL